MYSAPAIKKAVRILRLIVEKNRPLNVTEISRQLSISKSTTHGILKALEEERLVLRDRSSKKYVIGKGLFDLLKKVFSWLELSMIARSHMEELVNSLGETVFLGVREGERIRVVDVREAQKELRVSPKIDTLFPITAPAFLKLHLARFDEPEIKSLLMGMRIPKYTENTVTEPEKLFAEIMRTKTEGFSRDREEYIKGVVAYATWIPKTGKTMTVLCVLGLASSITEDRVKDLGSRLKEAASSIGDRMSLLHMDSGTVLKFS